MEPLHQFSEILPYERSYVVVPGKLIAGHLPSAQNGDQEEHVFRINRLIDVGINLIINLMEENEIGHNGLPLWNYSELLLKLATQRNHSIKAIRKSIPDLGIPAIDHMIETLDLIDACNQNSGKVYIHCWGGIGRTGTVVGCYLLRHKLADKNNVFHYIEYLRRTTPYSFRPSPETDEQRHFILNWNE